jgi:hypothetical protein
MLLTCTLLVCGCDRLLDVGDYFSPVASEALVLGVEDPDIAALVGGTAAASAFLARASSLTSVAANLFDDADSVRVDTGSGSFALASQGDGLYLVTSADDPSLDYVSGSTWTLSVTDGGSTYTASGEAPAAPVLTGVPVPPATHGAGQPLSVGLGRSFDNSLTIVLDDAGNVTWDSRPQGVSEYLDWIGGGGDVSSVAIPGEAFPNPGTGYVVGIAGVVRAPDAGLEGFNPLVSNLALGSMGTAALVTAP